ncbi:MAG TPA: hypothetical protein VH796_13315 [Nitrososphaeraceae archaeon]|jgi:hypothetical protein
MDSVTIAPQSPFESALLTLIPIITSGIALFASLYFPHQQRKSDQFKIALDTYTKLQVVKSKYGKTVFEFGGPHKAGISPDEQILLIEIISTYNFFAFLANKKELTNENI